MCHFTVYNKILDYPFPSNQFIQPASDAEDIINDGEILSQPYRYAISAFFLAIFSSGLND